MLRVRCKDTAFHSVPEPSVTRHPVLDGETWIDGEVSLVVRDQRGAERDRVGRDELVERVLVSVAICSAQRPIGPRGASLKGGHHDVLEQPFVSKEAVKKDGMVASRATTPACFPTTRSSA